MSSKAVAKPAQSDATAQAKAAKERVLPVKEQGLFKTLLMNYESKQHKQGIKTADQILKKYPNHGETLAIKALIIQSSLPHNHPTATSQPKGEEVDRLIASALRKDPYSHMTHHVHSIILRSKKDYPGASEALKRAREIDPENIPLIRDSISLLTQLGEYGEAQEGRNMYSKLRPTLRGNWVQSAVGYELCGEGEAALRQFELLRKASKDEGFNKTEAAQLSLHIIRLMTQNHNPEEALRKLRDDVASGILPTTVGVLEAECQIHTEMGAGDKAEETLRRMIEMNPDHSTAIQKLLKLKGIDLHTDEQLPEEKVDKAVVILEGFAESYPRASAPRRMLLDITSGEQFRTRVKAYVERAVKKGVPSLFSDLKGLYVDLEKRSVVEEVVEGLKKEYEASNDGSEALLWIYYYLALHHSHRTSPSPDYPQSLDLINLAIKQDPTNPDAFIAKAHVLKRAGDLEAAVREMEKARALDKSDRYISCKVGKYLMRLGEVEKAEQVLGLFTKKDAPSPSQDLLDMQCLWFLLEAGDAYRRLGNLPFAVKRYKQVIQIFDDYQDDHYDFHTYAIRKMTLDAYMNMIQYKKSLRHDKHYMRAAQALGEIYLEINDHPERREVQITAEQEAENKRAAKKAQKAGSKAKKAAAAIISGDSKKEEPSLPDEDPAGKEFLKDADGMKELDALMAKLYDTSVGNASTAPLDMQFGLRKGQNMHVVRNGDLLRSRNTEGAVHELFVLALLAHKLNEGKRYTEHVKQVIKDVSATASDASTYNKEWLQTHGSTPDAIYHAARAQYQIAFAEAKFTPISKEAKSEVEEIISRMVSPNIPVDTKTYKRAVKFLTSTVESDEEVIVHFKAAIRERLPLAMDFATKDESVKRREEWAAEDAKAGANGNAKKA